jgi:hydrogenase maturation protease
MQISIVGYGNTLRGDDGVGQKIAQIIESWNLPDVRSLALHQLTPELAEELARVDLAVFVDAYPAQNNTERVKVAEIAPGGDRVNSPSLGHTGDPRWILGLAQTLYGSCPEAWWILVPGWDFNFGDRLCENCDLAATEAIHIIETLLRDREDNSCTKSV